MPFYEYKVVPAPERAPKVKGLKGAAKFAQGLESLMNELAQDGWEYQRAESLPDEEKKGLMGGKGDRDAQHPRLPPRALLRGKR
jgi:hypothetical protein